MLTAYFAEDILCKLFSGAPGFRPRCSSSWVTHAAGWPNGGGTGSPVMSALSFIFPWGSVSTKSARQDQHPIPVMTLHSTHRAVVRPQLRHAVWMVAATGMASGARVSKTWVPGSVSSGAVIPAFPEMIFFSSRCGSPARRRRSIRAVSPFRCGGCHTRRGPVVQSISEARSTNARLRRCSPKLVSHGLYRYTATRLCLEERGDFATIAPTASRDEALCTAHRKSPSCGSHSRDASWDTHSPRSARAVRVALEPHKSSSRGRSVPVLS